MAFQISTSGERLNMRSGNVKPKRPVSTYTTPVKGHLVKVDTTGNDLVARCADGDTPYGIVWSVNNSNGVLSVLELARCDLAFETSGTVNRGDKIVSKAGTGTLTTGGFVRDTVKTDNTNGVGTVVATATPITGMVIVRFP